MTEEERRQRIHKVYREILSWRKQQEKKTRDVVILLDRPRERQNDE